MAEPEVPLTITLPPDAATALYKWLESGEGARYREHPVLGEMHASLSAWCRQVRSPHHPA
ncbi:hypothetical protein [Amycolatopsis anabasis]|uniref:hypothetical protein n=1 Tax=Amycolatopsis anabasis TaxID=1840409 RepID=UPI00131E053D|nr:hypothetical protein [Amycolatopsis anabasis]